jgi:hypothetical protein
MEIYSNKKTGKAFIYLDEQDDGRLLMVTPYGDVKALENHLFTEPIEVDNAEALVNQGEITRKQFDVYSEYNH